MPFVLMFSRVHIKEIEGELIGFASYGYNKLHYIAVDKPFIAIGVGTDIFKEIEHKINRLKIEPHNLRAKQFFMNKGFAPARRADNILFGPRILMISEG